MRTLSLYSGIGLHDAGLQRAGFTIVGQVEWDAFASAVLEKHWPGLPRWKDVRDVSVESVRERCGELDCITGGFSCKNISVAGGGAGIGKDTESGITWRNMFRLIRGLRPSWLVIENVPRLRTLASDRVLRALERLGYACWPFVVGAEHVGAPHRRHRVWIVGKLADGASQRRERRQGDSTRRISDGAVVERFEGVDIAARSDSPHRCIFPGGCWRCAGELANAERDGRRQYEPERESKERASIGRAGASCESNIQSSSQTGFTQPTRQPTASDWAKCDDATGSGETGSSTLAYSDVRGRNIGAGPRSIVNRRTESPHSSHWPSRPGEPQHEWEPARLVAHAEHESESQLGPARRVGRQGEQVSWDCAGARTAQCAVGTDAARRARGLVRLRRWHNQESLRSAGNANPPQVAELIGRAIMHAHASAESGAAA